MPYFTGVGSRGASPEILEKMVEIGKYLASRGYVLRSGGANGADMAFEQGCDLDNGVKEIFLPWKNFNKNLSPLFLDAFDTAIQSHAYTIAKAIHPNWEACGPISKKFHSRNIFQVLGKDLLTPSEFVVCWTPNGKIVGGTATAINLALGRNIKVINLATEEFKFE